MIMQGGGRRAGESDRCGCSGHQRHRPEGRRPQALRRHQARTEQSEGLPARLLRQRVQEGPLKSQTVGESGAAQEQQPERHGEGELLGRSGWAAALDGLHPSVSWRDGGIDVGSLRGNSRVNLGGEGLLFIPTVNVWPGLAAHSEGLWPKALIYPARGSAALWDPVPAQAPEALAELLGRSRAQVLLAIDAPASTTHLARSLQMATGAVGDHLAVLLRAGLVRRARDGRSVLYRRTASGDAIAAAAES